ncbi:MAG TPA: hypothetical protein DCZ94_15095 [Lentisphaeria bacterium]|nr:hypothetical protein [Lentisphaeria bacterium]
MSRLLSSSVFVFRSKKKPRHSSGALKYRQKDAVFSHPDLTVGHGVPPCQSCVSTGVADFTAGQESGLETCLTALNTNIIS